MVQTVSVPGVGDLDFPDEMSQEEMAAAIQKNFPQIHSGQSPQAEPTTRMQDVPVGFQGEQDGINYDTPKAPEPSLYDKNMAVLKGAGVLAGNAIPATIGALGGSVYGLGKELLGAPKGSGAEYQAKGAEMLSPFSTNDPLANQYISNVGETLSPLAGLPGVGGEINAISRLAPSAARQTISKPIAAAAESQAKNAEVINRLQSGNGGKDIFGLKVDQSKPNAPKLVKDDLQYKAKKQGYDEGIVSSISAANPQTKARLRQMVDVSEKGKNDPDYGALNSPSDVPGESLAKRLEAVRDTNLKAGEEIEAAGEKIKGKPVNYDPALQKLKNSLAESGVSVDEQGKLNFVDSDLEFSPGDQKLISNIYKRASRIDGSDAYRVHKLKRTIDTTVDYGKGSQSGVTAGGERIAKSFRGAIDDALDAEFDDYNKANTKYSKTIREIDSFQKAAGGSVNIFGENAPKALAPVTRRLLGRTASRANLIDSIKGLENVAKEYGSTFDDDLIKQVLFADELDRVHGSHSKTALLGDIEKGAATGVKNAAKDLSQTTMTGALLQGGVKAYDYVNRITPQSQYRTLKELLARDAKKEEAK